MASLVLVDSSFLIRTACARVNPFEVLAAHAEDFDFAVCGTVWIETLRGRSDPRVRAHFETAFATMVFLDLTPSAWRRAASLAWEMDRRGAVIPATDLTIAACALEHGAALLTFDRHFVGIPGLHLLETFS